MTDRFNITAFPAVVEYAEDLITIRPESGEPLYPSGNNIEVPPVEFACVSGAPITAIEVRLIREGGR